MKKNLNLYLCSVVMAIGVMTTAQTIKAEDACAPDLIPPAQATQICQKVCTDTFGPTSQFNGQWNNDSPECHWFWYGQYGVCGCTPPPPCQCAGDKQTPQCTEPQKCSSNCNCAEGRSCMNGTCVAGYFCGHSNQYCPQGLYCAPNGWCKTSADCCQDCTTTYDWEIALCGTGPIGACQAKASEMYCLCQQTCECQPNVCQGQETRQQEKRETLPSPPPPSPQATEGAVESPPVRP